MYDYAANDPINLVDPSGLLPGDKRGGQSQGFYADILTDPTASTAAKVAAAVGGAFASLWTPCTSKATFQVLLIAATLGQGAAPAALLESAVEEGVVENAPVVVGENMARVNAYAGDIGGETVDDWLAGKQWTQELNDEYIAAMKSQGREFVDIGPDFGRRLANRVEPELGRPPSFVYGTERRALSDYDNYRQIYERAGSF